MPFPKDILLIDFETTGYAPDVTEPVELGAVLLDRATLEEKDFFHTLIYSDLKQVHPEIRGIWKTDQQKIKSAPKIQEVGKEFIKKFGFDVLVACWVQRLDRAMLNKIVVAAGEDVEKYDYHVLDLWPITYMHLIKRGYEGVMRSDQIFAQFGIPQRGQHDALEDCRIEAEIFRKIYKA